MIACVGRHPAPPRPRADRLVWYVLDEADPCRVHAATCWRCLEMSYELVSFGGAYAIRRARRTGRGEELAETPRVRRVVIDEWWSALLKGRAV